MLTAVVWGVYLAMTSCSLSKRVGVLEDHDFIVQVWPKDGAVIPIRCYQNSLFQDDSSYVGVGVGATILTSSVDTSWENVPEVPIPERSSLYVHDRYRPANFVSVPVGTLKYCETIDNCVETGRPYSWNLSWFLNLRPGRKDARLVIEQDNGELLEYSWSFVVIE